LTSALAFLFNFWTKHARKAKIKIGTQQVQVFTGICGFRFVLKKAFRLSKSSRKRIEKESFENPVLSLFQQSKGPEKKKTPTVQNTGFDFLKDF
jgi:hypothetical protein